MSNMETARSQYIYGLVENAKLLSVGSPDIYGVSMKLDGSQKFKRCPATAAKSTKPEKVILLVGATGAGKTTLINAFANHSFGVKWTDSVRFEVALEDDEDTNQAKSDTQGMLRDEEIIRQIQHFLSDENTRQLGITHLDAVCIVTQSARPRLTVTQQYIYNSVLALFGKDVAENIFLLCTFADDKDPPVLAAAKKAEIPYKQWFSFNNCALYADNNENCGPFSTLYWNMCENSIDKFFLHLQRTSPCRLNLTCKVLHERHALKEAMRLLVPLYMSNKNSMETIRKHQVELQQLEAEIKANSKYEQVRNIPYTSKTEVPVGQYATNCLRCNTTCYQSYRHLQNTDKIPAEIMMDGRCFVCPRNCYAFEHANMQYRFQSGFRGEAKIDESMKEVRDKAEDKKKATQNILESLTDTFARNVLEMAAPIVESLECLQRIQATALLPNAIGNAAYVDILIEAEKSEKRTGFLDSIKRLTLGDSNQTHIHVINIFIGDATAFSYYEVGPALDVALERVQQDYPMTFVNISRTTIHYPGTLSCADGAALIPVLSETIYQAILRYPHSFTVMFSPGCSMEMLNLGHSAQGRLENPVAQMQRMFLNYLHTIPLSNP
ncbi:uncharacterized protein LOC129595060 isoform X2 [Paramacrobiotus metropolitanus]|uniref:uncharacterized protein LOC129595060 isoform X2 n=1 Tax=Paramacrobiotus metropolitanus TaxID=2943436 RepID=UPI002445F19C|nr:uncharacterized protein LOC129595060 isoform X2 [Paramacrobiotus metropolitanus]